MLISEFNVVFFYFKKASEDEHQSEYVSNYDKRRQWITGFERDRSTNLKRF